MSSASLSCAAFAERSAPADSLRPTRAEVDLSAIEHNVATLSARIGDRGLLAIVKADAYGHGVVPVAKRLDDGAVAGFGVALAEEGLELRESGIRSAILVLDGVYGRAHRDVIAAGLTPVVYDLGEAQAFSRAVGSTPIPIHLKVDTGLSRLGVQLSDLPRFLEALKRLPALEVGGLMTHFACADSSEDMTLEQIRRFEEARALVQSYGYTPRVLHAANSAATLRFPASWYGMVRPGLALYGETPVGALDIDLRPALKLRSEVIALRELPPNASIGYGATFQTQRTSRIATVPMGYADCLPRAAGNRGHVLVRGQVCPIVGAVSMDLTTIDVTELDDVALGDEVVLVGEQSGKRLRPGDLGEASGTINYEILTNVSRRVPRVYIG